MPQILAPADPEGEPRFVMLETIHEYGRERLQDSGQAEDIQRRHAEYFTALAERAEPYTRGGADQMRWFRRLVATKSTRAMPISRSLFFSTAALALLEKEPLLGSTSQDQASSCSCM